MARIRTLKPEMLKDSKVAGLSDAAFRLFVSAIVSADDFGNLEADERLLRSQVWWAHHDSPRISEVLGELRRASLVRQYAVRGQDYLHLRGWSKHQRIDNAGKPLVPKHNDPDAIEFIDENVLIELSRGDSPRTAANRGDSPLDHDHDHDLDLDLPGSREPKVKKPRKAKRTIPDDWSPNESHAVRARAASLDVSREAERFRNHAVQNDRKCVDWDAAFRNWLLNAEERKPQQRTPNGARAGLDTQDILNLADDLERRGM